MDPPHDNGSFFVLYFQQELGECKFMKETPTNPFDEIFGKCVRVGGFHFINKGYGTLIARKMLRIICSTIKIMIPLP